MYVMSLFYFTSIKIYKFCFASIFKIDFFFHIITYNVLNILTRLQLLIGDTIKW